MNGGTDSDMSALSMDLATHSENIKTLQHIQAVENRLCVNHFIVYQHRDNGREASAISESSEKAALK